ncbi:hypothetical protein JCM10212_002604 [Sporobolomyces blumeae]
MDSGLWQTAALVVAPFVLPKLVTAVQAFLHPAPRGTRTRTFAKAGRRSDRKSLAVFRLFVVTLGLSISLFSMLSPPHNLFLSLSAPRSFVSRLFPVVRDPLDIRLATETLHRAWTHHVGRPLTDSEEALVHRLQTLDARLAYIAYGAGPVMTCSWCRPAASVPSSRGGGAGKPQSIVSPDYLLAVAPSTAIVYLALLAAMGLLLTGNGREKWRVWAVVAVVGAAGNEVWMRLMWEGLRGGVGTSVPMLHSRLHLHRTFLASLFLVASYFAPSSPVASTGASTTSIVSPAMEAIADQTEAVLNKLRVLSLERMAVLHNDAYRRQIVDFWSAAATESRLARADPTVQALVEHTKRSSLPAFEQWVEDAFVVGPGRAEEVRQGRDERRTTDVGTRGGGEKRSGE